MPFGSIAVTLALSCGFEEIFVAIGFNRTDVLVDGAVDVDLDVVPRVGLPVVVTLPVVIGLPVTFGACACCDTAIGRPCEPA
jgi:hypothetical protein